MGVYDDNLAKNGFNSYFLKSDSNMFILNEFPYFVEITYWENFYDEPIRNKTHCEVVLIYLLA